MQIRTEEILLIVNYTSKNKQTNKLTLEGEGSDIAVTALRCRDFPWKVPTALGAHLWSNKDGLKKIKQKLNLSKYFINSNLNRLACMYEFW